MQIYPVGQERAATSYAGRILMGVRNWPERDCQYPKTYWG
jgi:hypothetical protein